MSRELIDSPRLTVSIRYRLGVQFVADGFSVDDVVLLAGNTWLPSVGW